MKFFEKYQDYFKYGFEENKHTNKSALHPLLIKTDHYLGKIQYKQQKNIRD